MLTSAIVLLALALHSRGDAGLDAVDAAKTHAVQESAPAVADAEIEAYRLRLLETALAAASKLPSNPHVKTRSRLMQSPVDAALGLALPGRAQAWAEALEDWRRGDSQAALALHYARSGHTELAQRWIDAAREFAGRGDVGIRQDWQKDRILSKIAMASAWLGDAEQARALSRGLAESESGRVELAQAERSGLEDFQSRLDEIVKLTESHHWDLTRNALQACVKLHERAYSDAEKRALAERTIRERSEAAKLPLQLRIELLTDLAGTAARHADRATAERLLDEASALIENGNFLWMHGLPLRARLVGIRFAAGAEQLAKGEAELLFATYFEQRAGIDNWERCDVLIPIAEAFVAVGESGKALAAYRQALADGSENPNGRSRVEDLVPVLCSMALQAVEPDAQMWKAIELIDGGLKAPW